MPVTEQEYLAAKDKFVADVDIIHLFATASSSTTIDVGGGETVPSLKKVIADAVGDLANLAPKDGTGATGNWNINAATADEVNNLSQAQVEAALGGAVVLAASVGAANGVCELDATQKVPASRLPSYVDDVIESATKAALPATGEAGKIYVVIADESRSGTTTQYRWTGSVYARISSSPGSTDEVPEGATNKYFTESRVLATVLTGYAAGANAVLAATDSALTAFGKLQAQITSALAYAKAYDFTAFVSGKPAAGATILFVKAARAFTVAQTLTGTQCKAKTAATGAAVFTLYKNGVSFGTLSFAASGTTPTLAAASATSFAVGDELTVTAPGTQDATLADIALTLLVNQN